MKNTEIERSFIVDKLPKFIRKYKGIRILQGYIGDGNIEMRLRKYGKKYFITIKSGTGLVREEFETEISKRQFDSLWPAVGKWLEKTRYVIPYNSNHRRYEIDLDVYSNSLKGLITAEVEFQNEKEASLFNPPNWFGKDVTENEAFSNSSLAKSKKVPKP